MYRDDYFIWIFEELVIFNKIIYVFGRVNGERDQGCVKSKSIFEFNKVFGKILYSIFLDKINYIQ